MNEFTIGDFVQIMCKDGATFKGVIQDFTEDYVLLNGCGYMLEDIVTMEHA